ncbi:rhesus-associated glycoprotein [Pelomyxa schiedti]|nr:rhesus-associated glycoprotein [Pelomyxa schiedti]
MHSAVAHAQSNNFALLAFGAQLMILILFGCCTEYCDDAKVTTGDPVDHEYEGLHEYTYFSDVHIMIFVGFGFLMTFLKKYGFSAVAFNFFLSALAFQWAILVNGFWNCVNAHEWVRIPVSIESIIEGDFAAGSVMISFGAVIGKVSTVQLTIMTIIHLIVYGANKVILERELEIVDIGGSLVIHAFGAYFGLTVSRIVSPKASKTNDDCGSVYHSDLFAMIGTIFLWIMWPSFNAALAGENSKQERTILNTAISLAACCVVAFALSQMTRPHHHFDMVDIQNATLAGGVAVGASACMNLYLVGAMAIGITAGTISTLGFRYLQPFLQNRFGLHDTCGVHNLHGMPGLLGGLCAVIAAAIVKQEDYGTTESEALENIGVVFPEMGTGRSASEQALCQLAGIGVTLGMALVGGAIAGGVLSIPGIQGKPETFYHDMEYWHMPDWDTDLEKAAALEGADAPADESKDKDKDVSL